MFGSTGYTGGGLASPSDGLFWLLPLLTLLCLLRANPLTYSRVEMPPKMFENPRFLLDELPLTALALLEVTAWPSSG